MDSLVLTRVARSLDGSLRGGVLEAVLDEPPHRVRFVFRAGGRPRSVAVSLEPASPWIARPTRRSKRAREPRPFAAAVATRLRGLFLVEVFSPPSADRRVEFRFADGERLVAEPATPAPDLVLVDASGTVLARAGRGRAAKERLAPGAAYCARALPRGRVDPFVADAAEIDAALEAAGAGEAPKPETVRRALLGIGRSTAEIVLEEARLTGRSPGQVLTCRLDEARRGAIDPVVEAPWEPETAVERGEFDPALCRLLPWEPLGAAPTGRARFRDRDPSRTVGRYYEALGRGAELRERAWALQAIVAAERVRLRVVAARVAADARRFADSDLWRRRGEALLAGLTVARRAGNTVLVPDPYDPGGARLAVPVAGDATLPQAADACFRRHRRAVRGQRLARERAAAVGERLGRFERLAAETPGLPGSAEIDRLEQALREAGIPVAVEHRSGSKRGVRRAPARVEGARMFRTPDGWTGLIGKSGPDNARLTFRLAGPEDFWFHAEGVRGAHVVLRNEERATAPPRLSLEAAAAAAAWFSDAREQPQVDVQWTRRKYVRKVRGATPGTVRLKRFETVRVRPVAPRDPRH